MPRKAALISMTYRARPMSSICASRTAALLSCNLTVSTLTSRYCAVMFMSVVAGSHLDPRITQ